MSILADAFPENDRKRFASDNLIIGAVIKVFVTDTTPPKEKRMIIVGESYDHICLATVYINTEINVKVFPSQDLKDLNPAFSSDGRDYLDHDSHIDCSNIHSLKKDILITIIAKDPSRILGNVSAQDLKTLRDIIKSARTIKASVKKIFGLFL